MLNKYSKIILIVGVLSISISLNAQFISGKWDQQHFDAFHNFYNIVNDNMMNQNQMPTG